MKLHAGDYVRITHKNEEQRVEFKNAFGQVVETGYMMHGEPSTGYVQVCILRGTEEGSEWGFAVKDKRVKIKRASKLDVVLYLMSI